MHFDLPGIIMGDQKTAPQDGHGQPEQKKQGTALMLQ
jgi:hypothetical protein